MSLLFGGPCIQGARGVGAGPGRPAQPGLILVLLGCAEAAGLQQRGETATGAQRWTGLSLQETGLGRGESLAARRGVVREDTPPSTPPPNSAITLLTSPESPLSRSSHAGSGRPAPPACRPPSPRGPWCSAPACCSLQPLLGSWARAATAAPCCYTPVGGGGRQVQPGFHLHSRANHLPGSGSPQSALHPPRPGSDQLCMVRPPTILQFWPHPTKLGPAFYSRLYP